MPTEKRSRRLIAEVAALFGTENAAEWAARLGDADCCFTPVIAPSQLMDEAQIRTRGMVGVSESGVPWMRSPIRLGADVVERGPAPAQGEHTRQILSEIGYADAVLDQMQADGIIRQAP